MGLKKKLQAARLTADERRSASQGAGRHAVNGMMTGAMAGGLAGLAVFPFAPFTAPAGIVAGAVLGLAAGAGAGAIDAVRRERQFERYQANLGYGDESQEAPRQRTDDPRRNLFPGEGRTVGERHDFEGASAPPSDGKAREQRRSSASGAAVVHARSYPSFTPSTSTTTSTTPSSLRRSRSSSSDLARSRARQDWADDNGDGAPMTDKERRRATKMLEKELAREQKLALKEEKKRRKQARKEELERLKQYSKSMKKGGTNGGRPSKDLDQDVTLN